jgi:hypothetical protein
MAEQPKIITEVPDVLDLKERWLIEYWASELGVSIGRLKQCASIVGPKVSKIRTLLKDGHRIAIEDSEGAVRLVGRITMLDDGFSIQVPYHSAKNGWLLKTPIDYSQREGVVPLVEQFAVSDTVKLSLHMSGFVHFSTAGQQRIISGYCDILKKPKGLGFKAPDPIEVSSGPLCGIVVQGLSGFALIDNKPAEVFNRSDFWFNPAFPKDEGTYHIEIFMLNRNRAGNALNDDGKRTVTMQLPFWSKFRFPHTLRIVELPGLWFSLGLIVSPTTPDSTSSSGYKLNSPGFGEPGEPMHAITAWYPRPVTFDEELPSLDYVPQND